jgi:hypothetical protein
VDSGSSVGYGSPNYIPPVTPNPSSTERFIIASGDSFVHTVITSVDATHNTANPEYYHQYQITLEYNIANIPAGSPTVTDIVTYTSFGTTGLHATPTLAPTDTSKVWVDATSSVTYTNPIVSGNERWTVSGGASPYVVSSSVAASSTLNPTYYHQFKIIFWYTVSGGGTPTAPTVDYTKFGSSQTMDAATDGTSYDWVDAGTTVWYTNPLSNSGSTERWQANYLISSGKSAIGGSVAGSGNLNPMYYHQYLVTFGVTSLDSTATGTDTVVALTAKEFGSSTTPSIVVNDFSSTPSLFVDSGQSLGYTFTSIITSTAAGKQYAWASTSGTGSASSENTRTGSFTVSAVSSLSATYSAEYFTKVEYSGVYMGQYSDPVTLKATLTSNYDSSAITGKTITFYLCKNTATYPLIAADILQKVDGTTDGSGEASASLNLDYPIGNYKVFAVFDGNVPYLSSYDWQEFTVEKEDARVEYTGDSGTVTTPGETITIRLAATVTQLPDSRDGDLSLATLEFTIESATPGGFSATVHDVPVNSAGQAAVFIEDVPVDDSYDIVVRIESGNLYWKQDSDVNTILVLPSNGEGYVAGGGWIPSEESINGKINFAFVVHYDKRGNPKGSLVAVFKGKDGFNYKIKSTSWAKASLTLGKDSEDNPTSTLTVTGVVQKINRATGIVEESWGNCKITVDMIDGDYVTNQNGRLDKIAITVVDNTSTVLLQWGTKINQIAIGGGNIVVALASNGKKK